MKTEISKKAAPKHGDLRVWWIPQVPGKLFTVPVCRHLRSGSAVRRAGGLRDLRFNCNLPLWEE